MTDQQKKAVEEAASIRGFGITSFTRGAEEVLNNPEKYGLVSICAISAREEIREIVFNLWELNKMQVVRDTLKPFGGEFDYTKIPENLLPQAIEALESLEGGDTK